MQPHDREGPKKPVALVVEDDPELQAEMGRELRRIGYDVRTAFHYDEAIAQIETGEALQLACIDLELPTRSGYEICEFMRGIEDLIDTPILVTSDSGFMMDMAYAEKAGANAFLRKPFSMKDLATYVRALVDNRKPSEPGMWRLWP